MSDLKLLVSGLAPTVRLDLAEIPREAVLLFSGQRLTGDHHDVVITKNLKDPPLRLWR